MSPELKIISDEMRGTIAFLEMGSSTMWVRVRRVVMIYRSKSEMKGRVMSQRG